MKVTLPSIGQIIPHNSTIGKNDPKAKYVAVLSVSQRHDTTKPDKQNEQFIVKQYSKVKYGP